MQAGRELPSHRTALLSRKPAQSALAALHLGKAAPKAPFPRREAIHPFLTQAVLGLKQVTSSARQTGRQAGTPYPRTALLPRKPVRSALTALLPGRPAPTMLFPGKEAIPPLLRQITV